MTINRWLGTAQAKIAKQALQPFNVTPGSVWILRVGSVSYPYTYPASIENDGLDDNGRAEIVTEGLVQAYSGGGTFGGGSSLTVSSLTSGIYNGRWSLIATGADNGAPLDVSLSGDDPTSARISVVQLQAGRAAQNEIQLIKFPATPTAGTWFIRYRAKISSAIAYNATAATVQTAIVSVTNTTTVVTGSYTDGFTVEFQGANAGRDVDKLVAWSEDFAGVASYKLEVTNVGGIGRQTYALPDFDGDANKQYRFTYDGDESHLFTGATSVDILIGALESIESVGEGNVAVSENPDGSYSITLIGEFVGRTGGDLVLVGLSDASETPLETSPPILTANQTVVQITILNMPALAGTFTLTYDLVTTAAIDYNGATISTIQAALNSTVPALPWTCTSVTGDLHSARVITLTAVDNDLDAGVILPNVSNLLGCNAIEIRTTQLSQTARNSIQQVAIETNPTGGTFTLTFGANTTAGLAYNASAATIQTALQGLASIGASNATVAGPVGGPFIAEFVAALGAAPRALIVGNGASLTLPTIASSTSITVLAPTGPNWWTDAANWSLGVVPDSNDVATFDLGSISCVYGISGVAIIAGIDVYRSFTGRIGLPENKEDGSPETLPQYLSLSNGGGTIPIRIGLGDEGSGPPVVRINTQSQSANVTLLHSALAGGNQLYTVGLAGLMPTVHAADCSLQIATGAGQTATITSIRVSPQSKSDEGAVVEWGEGATITTAEIVAGTTRMGSVPANLVIHAGVNSVRGSGTLRSLQLRNSRLRYLAGGTLGQSGAITAMAVNGSSEARVTSASHGLASGDRIYLRGVVGITGLPDGYYTVLVVDANTLDLIGTAPAVPYGAIDPATIPGYYQSGQASWGLADAIRVGVLGVLDFSELSSARTAVAPILLQAEDAEVIDTLKTISGLRIKGDPGFFETTLGSQAIIKRE